MRLFPNFWLYALYALIGLMFFGPMVIHILRSDTCARAYGGPGIETAPSVGLSPVCWVKVQRPWPEDAQ